MTSLVGIIAEDDSDIGVVDVIIKKIAKRKYSIKSFAGHGSGRVRNKCNAWAKTLKDSGCQSLILVHDLDANRIDRLLAAIRQALDPSPIQPYVIVIPVRELEAWLLADHVAIEKTFRFKKKLKSIPNPEAIQHPKEFLRDLVNQKSNHRIIYANTVHNIRIAQNCSVGNLKKCASFKPLEAFVASLLG
jgi:uncharacterized protein DUF4276